MSDTVLTFVAVACISMVGGASYYIQRLFDAKGKVVRDGSWLEACGWLLGTTTAGICIACITWSLVGDTHEGRLGVIGLTGGLALGGVILNYLSLLVAQKVKEKSDAMDESERPRGPRERPDSDVRPVK